MALQVWLPLNGDLRNQGLTKVSSISSAGGSFTDGKIGQSFNITTDGGKVSLNSFVTTLQTYTTYSMCAWVYLTSTATNHSSAIISAGNWNTSN